VCALCEMIGHEWNWLVNKVRFSVVARRIAVVGCLGGEGEKQERSYRRCHLCGKDTEACCARETFSTRGIGVKGAEHLGVDSLA